jgi:uncharacterized protein YegL
MSPFDRFSLLVDSVGLQLRNHSGVRSQCWLSIIAFNHAAHRVLPISWLENPYQTNPMPRGGNTNYGEVLRFLAKAIGDDIEHIKQENAAKMVKPEMKEPLIFFVTDGLPTADSGQWPQHRDLLVRDRRARIAAMGMAGSKEAVLVRLATGEDPDEVHAFIATGELNATQLADSIAISILRSVTLSISVGDMTIVEPAGMRRLSR